MALGSSAALCWRSSGGGIFYLRCQRDSDMVYLKSGDISTEDLFKKAFADRFASLDSLISVTPSEHDVLPRGGSSCRPCKGLLKSPDFKSDARGFQWVIFGLAMLGVIALIFSIFRSSCARGWVSDMFGGKSGQQHTRHDQHSLRYIDRVNSAPVVAPSVGTAGPADAAAAQAATLAVEVPHAQAAKLSDGRPIVVLVHATWCGHCKQMMPVFSELSKKHGSKIAMRTLESEKIKADPGEFKVQGFPTMFAIKDGQVVDTKVGGVGADELEKFLLKLIQ